MTFSVEFGFTDGGTVTGSAPAAASSPSVGLVASFSPCVVSSTCWLCSGSRAAAGGVATWLAGVGSFSVVFVSTLLVWFPESCACDDVAPKKSFLLS